MGLLKKGCEYLMAHNGGEGSSSTTLNQRPKSQTAEVDNGDKPDGDIRDNIQDNNRQRSDYRHVDHQLTSSDNGNTEKTDNADNTGNADDTSPHLQKTPSDDTQHLYQQKSIDATPARAAPTSKTTETDQANHDTDSDRVSEPVNTGRAVRTKRYKSASIPSGAILTKLQKISIFEPIKNDLDSLHAIIKITKSVRIGENLPIIEEGSIGNEMFIVYSGAVEIKKLTRAGDTYTVVKLSQAQNIFFGELALIDNDRRSATVTTLVDSTFLVINSKDFHELGKRAPHIVLPIVQSIAKILSKRLRKTTADMLTIFDALVQEISET